jgi:hypothetical protein
VSLNKTKQEVVAEILFSFALLNNALSFVVDIYVQLTGDLNTVL